MSNGIKYCKKRLKQENAPICGIYAFLNGFYDGNKKRCWNNLAHDLWNESLTPKFDSLPNYLNADIVNRYSLLGEFFSSRNLRNFLNHINNMRANNWNSLSKLVRQTGKELLVFHADYIDANLDWSDLIKDLDNEKTNTQSFYLVPINSWQFSSSDTKNNKKRDRNNMHWICVKKEGNKVIILNSASDKSGEKWAKKHAGKCKLRSISSIDDLNAIKRNMKEERDYKSNTNFNFTDWLGKLKYRCRCHKGYPEAFYERVNEIRKKDTYEYSFEKSNFDILKVTYWYRDIEKRELKHQRR